MRFAVLALGIAVIACGSNPTTPVATSYAGSWSGTTAQGTGLSFAVATNRSVTDISISHNFSSCSGTLTSFGLRLPIAQDARCVPGPCPAGVSPFSQFSHTFTTQNGAAIEITGLFVSSDRAEGQLNFRNYSVCGDAIGVTWQASKQ